MTMKSKLLAPEPHKTYALVFETGDDPLAGILEFARMQRLDSSSFTAIGAFAHAVLGFFDFERKDYLRIPVEEQCEVVSLTGNIALKDGSPKLHIHAGSASAADRRSAGICSKHA